MDCTTTCWFKHNILNPAYELDFLVGHSDENEQNMTNSDMDPYMDPYMDPMIY
jgi:hypothetical protein